MFEGSEWKSQIKFGDHLSFEQKKEVLRVIAANLDVILTKKHPLGLCNLVKHLIEPEKNPSLFRQIRRSSLGEIDRQVKELLNLMLSTLWTASSPAVFSSKKRRTELIDCVSIGDSLTKSQRK